MTHFATSPILLSWLVQATIKGSIVILLVAMLQRLMAGRVDARWRHALWLIVLVRLMVPMAPSSSWSLFNLLPADEPGLPRIEHSMTVRLPEAPAFGVSTFQRVAAVVPPTRLATIRWAIGVWLAGVLLLALNTLISSLRLGRAVARAVRRNPQRADLTELLEEGRRRLGIRTRVRIIECDAVRTPALHGLVRPTLLLPIGLAESFGREEIRHVIVHELWHLRRFDVGVSWLLSAVQTLHWFNPFVWFAASRIKEERELACDELALSCLEEDERSGYGRTILKLLERFRVPAPVPALVGIVNHKQKMKRRLLMIASFRDRSRFSMFLFAVVALVGLVGLTDARGGERHMVKRLDPAALGTLQHLDERVSFELNNATLSDLLNAVANKAGVAVTQSPELATLDVQKARFNIKADNVPAHAVLMEALMPFGLMAKPDGNAVTIAKGECQMAMAGTPGQEEGAAKNGTFEKRVIIVNEDHRDAQTTESRSADGIPAPHGDVMYMRTGSPGCKFSPDGKMHREMTLNIDENGVKSQGKLTIDISNAK